MESPPSRDESAARLVRRGLLGAILGLGACVLLLVLAGAPPFSRVFAQAPGANLSVSDQAAQVDPSITGAVGTYSLPIAASEHAGKVDFLFWVITAIVGVAFVAVEVLLVWFGWQYRHRPGRRAVYTHGNKRLEAAWTITPAVILAVLVFLSRTTWSQIRYGPPPEDGTKLEVTARQFQWNVKVLGTADRFGKIDDLGTINTFKVPVDKPVIVSLKARDVLHSFFLPNMRVKLDAVPGMTGHLWFTPNRPGIYELVCAELCGAEHWKMRGTIEVCDQAEFDKWLGEIKIYTADKPK